MNKTLSNVILRVGNAAGILCIVFGPMSAARTYSSLYSLATTGLAPTGVSLADHPATIHTQLLVILLGFLLLELSDLFRRRYMRSNKSFKPTPLRGAA